MSSQGGGTLEIWDLNEDHCTAQLKDVVARIMADVRTVAPVPPPDLEELRMALPAVGCWNPRCVTGSWIGQR